MLGILTAVAVLLVFEAAKRVHVNRQGKIVSPHWPHDWHARIDDVTAKCAKEVATNADVRRDIAGVVPGTAPPDYEAILALHADGAVAWVRGCAAINLYPSETWPPTAADAYAKRLVWEKLAAMAATQLGVA